MTITSTNVVLLPDGRMDTLNASNYVKLSLKTMAMMRSQGTGPKFIKRGRIFYYQSDLDEWINAAGKASSTSQHRANKMINEGRHEQF